MCKGHRPPTCPKLEPLAQCTWNSDDLSVWILSWHHLRRHGKCAHCALLSPRKINHFLILTCIGCNAYKCRFLIVGVFHCLCVLIGTVDNNDLISECALPIYCSRFPTDDFHLFSSCVLRLLLWLLFLPVSSCITLLVLRLFPVFLFPSAWLLRFPLFLSLLHALFALSCFSMSWFDIVPRGQQCQEKHSAPQVAIEQDAASHLSQMGNQRFGFISSTVMAPT